ncbi:hydrolase 2, exosortase A system-associated [Ectothiorhodospira variabilis]|uniref:hydrolase 2, exosortase A system-associated n=1 Tax=Ectothiorhodospira variabilis TaxID=505694 RepID=UPI0030845E21
MRRRAFFLGEVGRERFCLATGPQGPPLGGVLFVHPFGEELNKSRRMVSLAARAFADRGWLVLQLDRQGCGDSAGDSGEASWGRWRDDVSMGFDWLCRHCEGVPVVWSLRAGALLVSDWLEGIGKPVPLLFWQPVDCGARHLRSFWRLKAAADMLEGQAASHSVTRLRDALAAGRSVEVAGYRVAPELAAGMEAARLSLSTGYAAQVGVAEVNPGGREGLSTHMAERVATWRQAGTTVVSASLRGPRFWDAQEIEVAPELIGWSLDFLAGLRS